MRLISEARYRKILHALFRLLGKKLVVINIDYMGLGNRLKLLASYHVNYGIDDVLLFWNRQGWVNCALGDIISIEGARGFREIPIEIKSWMVPIITHPSKPTFWERGYWRFDVADDLPQDFEILRHGRRFPAIDFRYEQTPPHYLEAYRAFFARLKPSPAVRQRMATLALRPDDVCVQVRISLDEKDRANVPRLQSYLDAMAACPREARFFISTLGEPISAEFRRVFGERIIELPGKNYRSMIDATADMYLLSQGGTLIVSEGSTFGEVAWWLGGCRQRVQELKAEVFAA